MTQVNAAAPADSDGPAANIRATSLAQLTQDGAWRLALAHDRPEHLLIWITKGQGLALINGVRRGVSVNNVLFAPAGSLFFLSLGRQVMGQAILAPPGCASSFPEAAAQLRHRDTGAQAELAGLFDALNREQEKADEYQQDAMTAYIGLLSIWLRRQMQCAPDPVAADDASSRLTNAYCARLAAQVDSGANVAAHAAALNVTPTHLTRVCKAKIGVTAADLLADRQTHAARRMLADTNLPVQDIARQLGFGSAAYFSRFIQRHTGQPPTALRRNPK